MHQKSGKNVTETQRLLSPTYGQRRNATEEGSALKRLINKLFGPEFDIVLLDQTSSLILM